MTVPRFTRVLTSLLALAALSACATRPQVTSQVESTRYRAHAGTYAAPGPASDPWGPYIQEAAAKYDVPERWVREVMRQESGGKMYSRGGDLITSGAGAMGLMQVMPATYDELRGRYSELGNDPFDPHNNILAGTAYIREMYDIYGSPGFLAAYNAGPGRLDDYLTRNRSLPEETRRYVASIGPRISGSEPAKPSPGAQYAMNAMPFSVPDGPRYAASSRYSAPAGPVIALNPMPYEPPARAPTPSVAPVQMAALPTPPASGNFIVLRPQPVEVAQIPQPPLPAAAPAPVFFAPPAEVAQLPEPPRPFNIAPPAPQQFAAAAPAASLLVPVAPRGFSLVSRANAEPIGIKRTGFTAGNWAVQVGAFANENLAASATNTARDHARDVLASAHASVSQVHQPHGTLYRARLTGLSRDSATQACERLSKARTNCIVVSPDAQS